MLRGMNLKARKNLSKLQNCFSFFEKVTKSMFSMTEFHSMYYLEYSKNLKWKIFTCGQGAGQGQIYFEKFYKSPQLPMYGSEITIPIGTYLPLLCSSLQFKDKSRPCRQPVCPRGLASVEAGDGEAKPRPGSRDAPSPPFPSLLLKRCQDRRAPSMCTQGGKGQSAVRL